MTAPLHDDRVFSKPGVPENTWQLLSWVVFEPILLERYRVTLSKKQTLTILLKAYCCIVLISFGSLFIGLFCYCRSRYTNSISRTIQNGIC